jgi:signal transduction histidine kinase
LIDDEIPGVEISVQDTGIGLDAEQQELVFEKFYQVGSVAIHSSGKTTYKGGGPGLGLAIVRGVARAHGGKTWVESAGHDETNFPGSTFYLQLPINPPQLLTQR